MVKKNACVFISGKGSNLKSLIKNSRNYSSPINIRLVICDNVNAKGILFAKINSIPFLVVNTKKRNFEHFILNETRKRKISIICLAGYMKVISKKFINNFNKIIINIHPSLLPKFKGLNTFERILENKEKKTGCTVHYVNEKLYNGRKIIQKTFFIENSDTEKNIKEKTQRLEHIAYSEAIIKLFRNN